MTTDLREVLRAVADGGDADPGVDLRTVVQEGTRRVRRRRATAVAAAGAVVAVGSTALLLTGLDDRRPDQLPAKPVELRINDAKQLDVEELASRRVTMREPMDDLSYDRFEGLTTDGLVLRSRFDFDAAHYDMGLLDPVSGETDWLPPPPGGAADPTVAELTSDRLVLVGDDYLLVFDRLTERWHSSRLRVPDEADAHGWPMLARVGPDGRLYVMGSRNSHQSAYDHLPVVMWWSVPLPTGGTPQRESRLDGRAVAWGAGLEVIGAPTWVSATDGDGDAVTMEPPEGCVAPEELAGLPVTVGLAGTWPVATYRCTEWPTLRTIVYDEQGDARVELQDAGFRTAEERRIVLGAGEAGQAGTFLLDLDTLTVGRLGPGGFEGQLGLVGDLVLWNQSGPIESRTVYDEVWKVGRLP